MIKWIPRFSRTYLTLSAHNIYITSQMTEVFFLQANEAGPFKNFKNYLRFLLLWNPNHFRNSDKLLLNSPVLPWRHAQCTVRFWGLTTTKTLTRVNWHSHAHSSLWRNLHYQQVFVTFCVTAHAGRITCGQQPCCGAVSQWRTGALLSAGLVYMTRGLHTSHLDLTTINAIRTNSMPGNEHHHA